jgi:hypothetical protein
MEKMSCSNCEWIFTRGEDGDYIQSLAQLVLLMNDLRTEPECEMLSCEPFHKLYRELADLGKHERKVSM